MHEPTSFSLETREGRRLHGLLNRPLGSGPFPAIVLAHGFKGFMEWGFFPPLADLLAARGFLTVRFNFSGGGMVPGEDQVSDFEAFRHQTISRERDELLLVLDSLETIAPGLVDQQSIGLLGHSRGGGNAILAAASPTGSTQIKALVTWSAVDHYDRFDEKEKARYRASGEWVVVNGRTGQKLPVSLDLLQDLESNAETLHLGSAAAARTAPWLLIHGADDPTVPVAEAHALDRIATDPHRLVVIEDADHVFNARHPFVGPTPALTRAFNHTQNWFIKHLR